MGMEELGGTPTPTGTGADNAGTPNPAPQGQAPPLNNPFAEITLAELGLDGTEGASEEGGKPPAQDAGQQVLSKQSKADETGSPGDAAKAAEPDEDEDEEAEEPEGEPAEEQPDKAEFEHPKFQKRVNRLTAEKKAAEEKAAELEAKVKELEAAREQVGPVEDPADPVWRLPEARKANEQLREATKEVDAAQAFLDRIEDGDTDGVVADLKAIKDSEGRQVVNLPAWDERTVKRALNRYLSSKTQELATSTAQLHQIRMGHQQQLAANRKAYDAAAAEHFTWLSDKSDPRTEKVEKLLKANPVLSREAVGRFAAAALVKELTRYQKAKANVTQPLAGAKAPKTTMPGAASGAPPPTPTDSKLARKATADKRFQENPTSEEAMTEWLAASVPGLG